MSIKTLLQTLLSSFFDSKKDWIKSTSIPQKVYSTVTLKATDYEWTVIAPCNGYVSVYVWGVQRLVVHNSMSMFSGTYWNIINNDWRTIMPCKKGDTIGIIYERYAPSSWETSSGAVKFIQTSE